MNKDVIDIVISWVDGNNPMHKKKIEPYLLSEFSEKEASSAPDDLAGDTRFKSVGEIFFCVASILRFAPFVRKIYIVTDNQNPNLDSFISQNFPGNKIPIEIIDHKILFNGLEEYLPVFNSLSVESCLYRIPGLSENFVYLNDDFFLVRDVKPTDWFINNKAVAYGYWSSIYWVKFLKILKPSKNGRKVFGFKDSMINATNYISSSGKYFKIDHTPQPMIKSVLERYFSENEEILIENINHKFRHETQFNPQVLFYMLALSNNQAFISKNTKLLYMKPVKKKESYFKRKFNYFEQHPDILFSCVGSLDLAVNSDKQKIFNWLQRVLNIKFESE